MTSAPDSGAVGSFSAGEDWNLPPLDRFLRDCITADYSADYGLTNDEMYGLYVSWCVLQLQTPQPSEPFWHAMSALPPCAHRRNHDGTFWPGLRMTGPAAVDYILTSRPLLS